MSFTDPMSPDFPFTLGIEEEYQVVDPETRELRSYITQILERGQMILREQIKPEMHQSIVEVGTRPCRTVAEARAEVTRLRGTIAALADKHGLKILAAGTHPISSWMNQEITPFERYKGVVDEMQDLALQLLIFGMHVHIGMPNNDVAIDLMNVARYILPHMLALSTSSPFWMGRNTGFKSYRSAVFSNFPRTGIPPSFVSRAEFDSYINLLISTGSIDNGKKIWWDMRPHPQLYRAGRDNAGADRQVLLDVRKKYHLPRLPARTDQRKQVARAALRTRRQDDRFWQTCRGRY
jgi:glutamate---cysteine ligase / carboxylate-amine ligase